MFLYKVLGIEEKSNLEQIKRAYKNKAKANHPDINDEIGSDIAFMLIKKAYDILSNNYQRDKYDNSNIGFVNLPLEVKNSFLSKYKDSLKKDLSLSVDLEKLSHLNRDLELANAIYDLTVLHDISPLSIEKYFEDCDLKYISTYEVYSSTKGENSVKSNNDKSTNKEPFNLEESENVSELKRDNKNSQSTLFFIIVFVTMLLVAIIVVSRSLGTTFNSSRQNPFLYWDVNIASVNFENMDVPPLESEFLFLSGYDSLGEEIIGVKCLVTGVKFTKNIESKYYLDDSIDNAEIEINTNDFKFGVHDVFLINSNNEMEDYCSWFDIYNPQYNVVKDKVFLVKNGEVRYLLFEVYEYNINDPEYLYFKDLPFEPYFFSEESFQSYIENIEESN